jgi:DNA-binding NtrC family response regulator
MSEQAIIPASISGTVEPAACFMGSASRAMKIVESVASEIAATSMPVMIVGESGSGKQVLARWIHEESSCGERSMVRVVCGTATPEGMAVQLRLNERKAHPMGTVIFDEVGDLDRECQRRLLHALPDGDSAPSPQVLAARVISTTSHELEEEVRGGRFRNDLYYRLNGVCLRIPPLRERREDIAPLTELFLAKHAARFGRTTPSLSAAGMARLVEHSWSGNIRELENVVMKILALADEETALADLSNDSRASHTPRSEGDRHSLKAAARAASRVAEREMILKALARTRWNRKRAAQELQISYKSLLYKLKQIGLPNSESE